MDEPKKPVVIEQTSKRYKLMQLVGAVLLALCLLLVAPLVPGFYGGDLQAFGFQFFAGLLVGFVGCGFLLVGQFLAWWHHG